MNTIDTIRVNCTVQCFLDPARSARGGEGLVRSRLIFVAGRSQILGTDNKCRVVVAHSSKLLIEFS